MNPDKPIISVRKLHLQRDGSNILTNINWQLMPGEHWAIIGANGCGKTTLLKVLTGYAHASSGQIALLDGDNETLPDWNELRQSIGLVSQSLAQHVEANESAFDVVLSGLHAMINFRGKISRKERQLTHTILKRLNATPLADRLWRQLSQGERQRILIGRALIANPRILFLDEPCAGLDPVAREHFLHFLDHLASHPDAPSLVLVTHHLEEIMPHFTHLLAMRNGRIIANGPKPHTLNQTTLQKTFSSPLQLKPLPNNPKRWQMILPEKPYDKPF